MATVRMRKGQLYADIFDSEETIKNAMNDGYVMVTDEKPVKVEKPVETEKVASAEKVSKPKTKTVHK